MSLKTDSDVWRELELIVDACLELPGPERASFLISRCSDDSELLESALDLVFAAQEASTVATPVWRPARSGDDPAPASAPTSLPAGSIERFELIEQLGQGGMGIVYLAEQTEPVRRRVALKVSRHPIGDAGRARLAVERQAMARLHHPNIAQVLEAGSSTDGHPFFALELVADAQPITDFCDQRRLTLRQRLSLFLEVCAGVQHAHQKGILHRDLKPSNVLVSESDGETRVKIIDFGIAKILEKEVGSLTLTHGQILGTPAYLSPESLSGADPDTRADVYSLGVLLYELILGQQPLPRQRGETPLAHLHRILESPQTLGLTHGWRRLESHTQAARAKALDISLRGLRRHLGGELHWILDAALAHDPSQRYAAVSELSAEIERYLKDKPVLAGPPSTAYRARKFVARHRTATISALLLVLTLAGGLAGRSFEAHRANLEAREAALARDENARMLNFLLGLFAASDPAENQGRVLSAQDILRLGTERLAAEDLAESPRFKARLLGEIAEIHWALGDPREALALAEQVLALNQQRFGLEHAATAGSLHLVGTLASEVGDYERSERLLRQALALRQQILGPQSPKVADTLANLGAIQEETSRFSDAHESYQAALTIYRAEQEDSLKVASVFNNLGILYLEMGREQEATSSQRRATEIRESVLGLKHPLVHQSWRNLGQALVHQGHYEEAVAFHQRALDASEEILGPDHPEVGHAANNLGHSLKALGRWREAEAAYLRAEKIHTDAMGSAQHPFVAYPLTNLGLSYASQGRFEEAIRVHQRAYAIRTQHQVDAMSLTTSRLHLGSALRAGGHLKQAEPLLLAAREWLQDAEGGDFLFRYALVELGLCYFESDRLVEARELLEHAHALSEAYRDPTESWVSAHFALARLANAEGHADEARRLAEEAFEILKDLPAGHWRRLEAEAFLRSLNDPGNSTLLESALGG